MKIVLRTSVLIILIVVIYYFLFHSYEFKVNFAIKTLPGDVVQTLRIWNRSLDSAQVAEVDSFKHVRQLIFSNEREYVYDWYFESDDSVTNISVQISEPAHSSYNKIMVLIGEPLIEKEGASVVKKFYNVLKRHLEITKVRITGKEKRESEFCLCRTLEKKQFNKAQGMMENYLSMSAFIEMNGLKSAGFPTVHVTQWSHSKDLLRYDFCFPILETDSLPVVDGLEYKHFEGYYALKAEYNGNYITSDRAWYELYHYALGAGYKIAGLPVEYFVDNPNVGTTETNWKAEIYLPIESNEQ